MLSIVLVTYNSGPYLGRCLRSLASRGAEIIVVDNASSDGSAELARQAGVRVLANEANSGFAAAANQGARAATHDLVLFLNPDTALLEGLPLLEAALRARPDAAAAAGLLVDEAGRPQRGFTVRRFPTFFSLAFEVLGLNRLWPGNPVNRRYRGLDLALESGGEVEQPAGACLLVKKNILEQVGFWDERFCPLWFEDVDLCLRLRQAGFRILLEPRCRFLHEGGHSLEKMAFEERQIFWYRNLLEYVAKHLGCAAALGMRMLICAGASARMMAALLTSRHRVRAYRAVISLALLWRSSQVLPLEGKRVRARPGRHASTG